MKKGATMRKVMVLQHLLNLKAQKYRYTGSHMMLLLIRKKISKCFSSLRHIVLITSCNFFKPRFLIFLRLGCIFGYKRKRKAPLRGAYAKRGSFRNISVSRLPLRSLTFPLRRLIALRIICCVRDDCCVFHYKQCRNVQL